MKKVLVVSVLLFLFFSAKSQRTQLDFSVQLQNTNVHNVVIYPNPTFDLIFKIKTNSIVTRVEVINMLGKTIYSKDISTFNPNNDLIIYFPPCDKGVYMIKITFDDGDVLIKKLLYK